MDQPEGHSWPDPFHQFFAAGCAVLHDCRMTRTDTPIITLEHTVTSNAYLNAVTANGEARTAADQYG